MYIRLKNKIKKRKKTNILSWNKISSRTENAVNWEREKSGCRASSSSGVGAYRELSRSSHVSHSQ